MRNILVYKLCTQEDVYIGWNYVRASQLDTKAKPPY